MGSGVIKPNISTLMGLTYDQQRPAEKLRSDAFAMFYWAINIGRRSRRSRCRSFAPTMDYSPLPSLFPAALMVVSFAFFAAGKPFYAVETLNKRKKTEEERREERSVVWRISGLFAVVTFFWSIFDQVAPAPGRFLPATTWT